MNIIKFSLSMLFCCGSLNAVAQNLTLIRLTRMSLSYPSPLTQMSIIGKSA